MRQVYRIDLTNTYYLRGTLHAVGRKGIEGKLVDVSAQGAGLVFLERADPLLYEGGQVELGFRIDGQEGEFRTLAAVKSRSAKRHFVRYGFEFLDFDAYDPKVPFLLRAVFNRRRAPRVQPEETVTVTLAPSDGDGEGEPMDGRLVDLSTNGLAVELPFHAVEAFREGDEKRVTFTVPGTEEPTTVAAVVRGRRLAGPCVHVGLEYEPEDDGTFRAFLSAIEDYVSTREVDAGCVPG